MTQGTGSVSACEVWEPRAPSEACLQCPVGSTRLLSVVFTALQIWSSPSCFKDSFLGQSLAKHLPPSLGFSPCHSHVPLSGHQNNILTGDVQIYGQNSFICSVVPATKLGTVNAVVNQARTLLSTTCNQHELLLITAPHVEE